MSRNIRDEIVQKRKARIEEMGHTEGADIPQKRETPITPFLAANGLICEVKRRSPSKGAIAENLDAVQQAGAYMASGARNLSVLTEREGFGGTLDDLVRIKKTYPNAAVLRKDFLLDPHDIDVSWRAGADAVLLIAGILSEDRLNILYNCAKKLGMQALVEVHDDEDIRKAAAAKPDLVGINSRDLVSFTIDPLLPVRVKAKIDWNPRLVYESGVFHADQAEFAASCGFQGLLVGEAVVRDPQLPARLLEGMRKAKPARFWPEVARRLNAAAGKPLVKICGLTREGDARFAADAGADILGFVFWPHSPRRAQASLLRALRDVETPKVGVAVNATGAVGLERELRELLEEGLLDAVQLHGEEEPDDCRRLWPVHYKAVRPSTPVDMALVAAYHCPRILLDAAAAAPGGTGQRVDTRVLEAWRRPLWLAGGITPDNAARIAVVRKPELLDVASGVEESPGVKSREKMGKLLREVRNV